MVSRALADNCTAGITCTGACKESFLVVVGGLLVVVVVLGEGEVVVWGSRGVDETCSLNV